MWTETERLLTHDSPVGGDEIGYIMRILEL